MNPAITQTFHFADFQAFSALRREAAADTAEGRRVVAQQFEALFVQQLLGHMRQASAVEGGLFDAERMRAFESMHDQQLALSLAQGRGIGLADAILRHISGTPLTTGGDLAAGRSLVAVRRSTDVGVPNRDAVPLEPETPAQFVDQLRPHVQAAARRLGIEPEVLIAQAALETGWGRHRILGPDGRESYNLFGIKATDNWDGDSVTVSTLEFVDGVPERRRERFRAYTGLEQAVDDYVELIAAHHRYQAAREAGSAEGYLRGLQAGGYATDPRYADKIIGILRRGLPGAPIQVSAKVADSSHVGPVQALSAVHRGEIP